MEKVLSEEEESILQHKPTQGSHSILYWKQPIKNSSEHHEKVCSIFLINILILLLLSNLFLIPSFQITK